MSHPFKSRRLDLEPRLWWCIQVRRCLFKKEMRAKCYRHCAFLPPSVTNVSLLCEIMNVCNLQPSSNRINQRKSKLGVCSAAAAPIFAAGIAEKIHEPGGYLSPPTSRRAEGNPARAQVVRFSYLRRYQSESGCEASRRRKGLKEMINRGVGGGVGGDD